MGPCQPSGVKSPHSQLYPEVLGRLNIGGNDLDCIAREMIKRFDEAAAWVARELAEIADRMIDWHSAKSWRHIARMIEQLQPEP